MAPSKKKNGRKIKTSSGKKNTKSRSPKKIDAKVINTHSHQDSENTEDQIDKSEKLNSAMALEVEKVRHKTIHDSPVDKLFQGLENRQAIDTQKADIRVEKIISEIQSVHKRNVQHLNHLAIMLEKLKTNELEKNEPE